MSEKKIQSPQIENIVGSGTIADSIDLEMLIDKMENYELNKKSETEIRAVLDHLAAQDRALAEIHTLLGGLRDGRSSPAVRG